MATTGTRASPTMARSTTRTPTLTRFSAPKPATTEAAAPAAPRGGKRKLSYKEQRELDALPALIESLESEQATIQAELADGTLYSSNLERALALQARDTEIEDALMTALERWEILGEIG